jgi:iron complex transport system substrate-binding protein
VPSKSSAMRIATLLPSITEIVASIPSLRNHIIAVTHECDYPPEVVAKAERITTSDINPHKMSQAEIDRLVKGSMRLGHSLYGLNEAKLVKADPTIVFTQALCDVCAPAFPMVLGVCARVLGDNPRIISIGKQIAELSYRTQYCHVHNSAHPYR